MISNHRSSSRRRLERATAFRAPGAVFHRFSTGFREFSTGFPQAGREFSTGFPQPMKYPLPQRVQQPYHWIPPL